MACRLLVLGSRVRGGAGVKTHRALRARGLSAEGHALQVDALDVTVLQLTVEVVVRGPVVGVAAAVDRGLDAGDEGIGRDRVSVLVARVLARAGAAPRRVVGRLF